MSTNDLKEMKEKRLPAVTQREEQASLLNYCMEADGGFEGDEISLHRNNDPGNDHNKQIFSLTTIAGWHTVNV